MDEVVKLRNQGDGAAILVLGEESLGGSPELTRGFLIFLKKIENVVGHEAIEGGEHRIVVLHPGGIVGGGKRGAVDVIEQAMATEKSAGVLAPLREVVSLEIENDGRRRVGRCSERGSGGHSRCGS